MKSKRIHLTKFTYLDKDELFNLAKDKDIAFSCGWNPHQNADESLYVIKNILSSKECYAIKDIKSNKLLGSIELKLKDRSEYVATNKEAELGFWIGKPYHRQGYCYEAILLMLQHAFVDLKLSIVYCGYFKGNIASQKIQEKVGFKFIKEIKNYYVKLINQYKDIVVSKIDVVNYLKMYVKDNK